MATPEAWQSQIFKPLDVSQLNAPKNIGKGYMSVPYYSTDEFGYTWENGTTTALVPFEPPEGFKKTYDISTDGEGNEIKTLSGFTKDLGTVNGVPITASYNAQGELTGYSDSSSKRTYLDQYQSVVGGWDANGNPQPKTYVERPDAGGFLGSGIGWSDLKPILATTALAYGLPVAGSALGSALGIGTAGGSALVGAGLGAAQGQDLGQIATNAAIGGAAGALGSTVGAETGSQAAGQLTSGTTSGLLRGQDLGTAAGNAALSTGAYQAAGGLMNSFNTPSSTADYSTGANYDLTTGQDTGGLGLKATLGESDSSNPYAFNVTNTGGLGVSLGDIGLNANPLTGQTLGSSLAGINTGVDQTDTQLPTSANPNPATQNLLAKLLLTGLTGNTTGTNNMATTTANNNLLGSLLGGALTSAGGLMQGSTTAEAQKAQADALRQAGQLASSQAQFRPVGTTTTFGTSNFQVDPTTGQLTSAGYTLSPEMQAYQNQIMGANRQSLNDATTLQNLGRGYLAQSPQEAAQNWLAGQQALLQPGRDVESARLANQLQQTGRTGVSVAQGGALGMANPEQQALANARAMQDLQLASQAQQQGQAQTTFGQGLLSSAYQPFNAGLTTASNIEQLGQNPLALSSGLAQQSSAAGAKAGQLQLGANQAASQAALGAANYNPWASALSGLGGSSLFGNALGTVAGNTGLGSALGSWLGSLNASDWSSLGNNLTPDQLNSLLTNNATMSTTPNYLDTAGQLPALDYSNFRA